MLLVGVGFLKLLHHDVETELQALVDALRVDPDNRYVGALLAKLSLLDDKKIEVPERIDVRLQRLVSRGRHRLVLLRSDEPNISLSLPLFHLFRWKSMNCSKLRLPEVRYVGDQCGNRYFPNSKGARVER